MQLEQTSSTDLLTEEPELVRASTGKRFLNYLIDVLSFYLFLIVLGIVLAIVSPESVDDLASSGEANPLMDRLFSLLLFAIYMSLIEGIFNGKSLGKLITGTRAVNQDGSRIRFSTAFGRGFSRAVPFSAFSAFGDPCNPWQDRWTDTYVIDERASKLG